MSVRDLAVLGVLGALGWAGWRLVSPPAGSGQGDYLAKLAAAENAKRGALAKNPRSSASGLWQFTKETWQALGGLWGGDPSKAFGGLRPSAAEQNARLGMFTGQNAAMLSAAGITVTDATLYAAHFLGAPTALRVLAAPNGALLAPLIGAAAMTANRFAPAMTVGQFRAWLQRKMG